MTGMQQREVTEVELMKVAGGRPVCTIIYRSPGGTRVIRGTDDRCVIRTGSER